MQLKWSQWQSWLPDSTGLSMRVSLFGWTLIYLSHLSFSTYIYGHQISLFPLPHCCMGIIIDYSCHLLPHHNLTLHDIPWTLPRIVTMAALDVWIMAIFLFSLVRSAYDLKNFLIAPEISEFPLSQYCVSRFVSRRSWFSPTSFLRPSQAVSLCCDAHLSPAAGDIALPLERSTSVLIWALYCCFCKLMYSLSLSLLLLKSMDSYWFP